MSKDTSLASGGPAGPVAEGAGAAAPGRGGGPDAGAGADAGVRRGLRWLGEAFLRWREASVLLVAVGLIIYFGTTTGTFVSSANALNLSQLTATVAIVAAGEVLLLISGEIDLSVGQVYALAPFIVVFAVDGGLPLAVGLALAVLVAMLIGAVNGLVTTLLRVPSFVTTLGTLFILNGITLITSKGYPVSPPDTGLSAQILGAYQWAEIIWAVVIVVVLHTVLTSTRWGLHTIAVGGNPLGASEAGVKVNRVKVGNFMIASVLGAVAGILVSHRIGSVDPLSGGTNVMFKAVAAAVIGGTALAGGSGTILGGLLGALVLAILVNGFTLAGVNAFTFDLILGIAILIAMISNVHLARLRRAGRV
jgi:simple sugar transport system permease protein